MSVDLVPAIAGRDGQAYQTALLGYTHHLTDRLAKCVAVAKADTPASFDRVMAALAEASPADVDRVLTAPLVTQLLRTAPRAASSAVVGEFAAHLVTERAARGEVRLPDARWTALGDALVLIDGTVHRPVAVPDLRAIDALSPQALTMNAVTALSEPQSRTRPDEESLRAGAQVLDEAMRRLAEVSPSLHDLVSTCVLNVVLSQDPRLGFSSSTHGLYIGRVTIGASHWPDVPVESVMDALVHEGIHCLLLMLDVDRPLLTDDLRADDLPTVASPWTGNPLTVPTYVHAVMVWFGLSHLWASAADSSAFSAEVTDRMLRRALRGFATADVVAPLRGGSHLLSEHALSALLAMQDEVHDAILR